MRKEFSGEREQEGGETKPGDHRQFYITWRKLTENVRVSKGLGKLGRALPACGLTGRGLQ